MPTSRQRREAERRRLERQLQRRVRRDARRRRMLLLTSILGTLAVVAIVIGFVVMTGNDDKAAGHGSTSSAAKASPSTSPSVSPFASATTAAAAYPCTWTKSGTAARKVTLPPTTKPPRSGTVTVSVHTNRGPMTFRLNRAAAPCTVESFVSLAGQHYFDNTACHRLTSGTLSVLQCGDPTASGAGGPGYTFRDELTGKEKYTRGVLAMANAGANTNGSQFFIVYKDSQLSPNYTVFGTVTAGMSTVDKVAAKGADPAGDGKPKLPITLKTVAVAR